MNEISRTLLALMMALPMTAWAGSEKSDMAQVITHFNNEAQCIAPVIIRKINGKEAAVQAMGFKIEPGIHTMTGSATIDTSICKTVGRSTNRYPVKPLEANFEAGKTYYIGYDHSATNRRDWKLVIWKTEDES